MNNKIIYIYIFLGFIYINSLASPKIIIKLDDLSALNGACSGKSVMDYLIWKEVKFSYGVIANRLDNTSLKTLSPYLNAKDSNGDLLFEVWNHGLEHTCNEFSGSYINQKNHFDQATQLVKKYLGIQMHSFGSPCNTNNDITNQVVSEDQNYNVFMLCNIIPNSSKGFLALSWPRVEFENGTGNPECDFFVKNYNTTIRYSPKYMILQGHPNNWTTAQFEQFKLIIDFLIAQGCEFVLPYDYYNSLQVKSAPILQAEIITATQVKLNWIDNNNLKINFKIERTEDSLKWVNIGTSNENSTNSYIDNNIITKSGKCYYRIQPNIGIKTVYSNVVHVTNLNTDTIELPIQNELAISLFPNPCLDETTIKLNMVKAGIVSCNIYDLNGKLMKEVFYGQVSKGEHQFPCNVSNFSPGIYFCNLITPFGPLAKKIVVKNK